MKTQKVQLGLETLEGRVTPSTTGLVEPTVVHTSSVVLTTHTVTTVAPKVVVHALAGLNTGNYICTLRYGTTNSGYHFMGTAITKAMGTVSVQAQVYAVGFHDFGNAHGTITFTNAKGSVTVSLTGPRQPRLSPLPVWFQYKVINATGAYRNLRDSGTLRIIRTPDAVPVRFGLRFFETGKYRIII